MTTSVVFVCSEKGLVNNMNTIQDLYYGRISPYEMSISAAPEYQKLKTLADRNEDLLKETLSNEQKELLVKQGTVSKTHRIRDRHILDLRTGYVHRRIPTWHEADDRRHEGRVTATVTPCKPM